MKEQGLTKNQIISELSRSPHGALAEYIPVGQKAAKQEAEFLAHLIAWNHKNGQIRDSKIALPIVSLSNPSFPKDLAENSLAHLAQLGPRELLKAFQFGKEIKLHSSAKNKLFLLVKKYLKKTEKQGWNSWQHLAIQHRHTLKQLYSLIGLRADSEQVNIVLYGQKFDKTKAPVPEGSIFEKVSQLKNMSPQEAAGTIMQWRIPFLVIQGALGEKLKDPNIALAMIKSMSATELVTNIKMLEKLGLKTIPALKGAYEEALGKAAKSTKNVLKTTRAAEAVKDETLKANLQGLQDKQLQNMGVEGNWLVLGDRSTSMTDTIEVARHVASVLAKMVKGNVWLCFFNTSPQM